jgi:hypothetical protein
MWHTQEPQDLSKTFRFPLNTCWIISQHSNLFQHTLKPLPTHTQTSSNTHALTNSTRNTQCAFQTKPSRPFECAMYALHKKSRKRPTCPRNSLTVRMKPKSEKSDHSIKSASDDGCIAHTCVELQAPPKLAQANHLHRTPYPAQDTWHRTPHMLDTLAQNIKHIGHMAQNTWQRTHGTELGTHVLI